MPRFRYCFDYSRKYTCMDPGREQVPGSQASRLQSGRGRRKPTRGPWGWHSDLRSGRRRRKGGLGQRAGALANSKPPTAWLQGGLTSRRGRHSEGPVPPGGPQSLKPWWGQRRCGSQAVDLGVIVNPSEHVAIDPHPTLHRPPWELPQRDLSSRDPERLAGSSSVPAPPPPGLACSVPGATAPRCPKAPRLRTSRPSRAEPLRTEHPSHRGPPSSLLLHVRITSATSSRKPSGAPQDV